MPTSVLRSLAALAPILALACATSRPPPAQDAWTRASAAHQSKDYAQAVLLYREALAALGETDGSELQRAHLLMGLGSATLDPEEGLAAMRQAMTLYERSDAPPQDRAWAAITLSARLRQTGHCAEAMALLEDTVATEAAAGRAVASGHRLNLANVHLDCGDLSRARSLYDEVLVGNAELFRPSALRGLATLDLFEGDLTAAERRSADALDVADRTFGEADPILVVILDLRSCILRRAGRDREGEGAAERAESLMRANPDWSLLRRQPPRLAELCR
jgi:tetratricopeptide (TPR) repeat protein